MARWKADGWLGLAEGFMAGEWDARDPSLLWELALKKKGSLPRKEREQRKQQCVAQPRERHFDFYSTHLDLTYNLGAADFINGPRTSVVAKGVREIHLDDPLPLPARKDMYDAQRRRVERVLLDAQLCRSDNVLFIGAEWGEAALEAAKFGASVTVLCENEDIERVLAARAEMAQAGMLRLIPGYYSHTGVYDVVITVSPFPRDYLYDILPAVVDTDVRLQGRIVVEQAWRGAPGRELPLAWWWAYVDTDTQLRSRAEYVQSMANVGATLVQATHADHHYVRSLELWDESFRACVPELGALGFDAVYRRLWRTALAIPRAAVRSGVVEYQRLVFVKR